MIVFASLVEGDKGPIGNQDLSLQLIEMAGHLMAICTKAVHRFFCLADLSLF
jgi:hypothetical protein